MMVKNSIEIWLNFLQNVIELSLDQYFAPELIIKNNIELPIIENEDYFTKFIKTHRLKYEEIILLLCAFVPHVDISFFDRVIQKKMPSKSDFPQFGGVRGINHRGFIPTAETVVFILGGNNLSKRLVYYSLFTDSKLIKKNIVESETISYGEPFLSGKIFISPEYLELFTVGKISAPKFTSEFPAELLQTELTWNDVVLAQSTEKQIEELIVWIKHNTTILNEWKMYKRLKPGYRALFHGPPGTGKTMAATLLGKYTHKDVYRIDLSMVVSKYIGETEKNLSRLFNKAENKNWILFFDEADALFGKRTNVRDAHDKYANQEVSYLLQRIENYGGMVILASNFKNNIDDAFLRRFQSVIAFQNPSAVERIKIWEKGKPDSLNWAENLNLQDISKKYDLTGASILNVIHYCCLQALNLNTKEISVEMILGGIKKEYLKESKIFNL
ncbi:MAG: ATP-binding protein [Flavobacteriales bacterium]|nr:ATP-binding protein [Flavobacteriales bacterium]